MVFSKFSFPIITSCFLLLFSCTRKVHTKEEVELAMKQYDHLIQTMNTDSISQLYAPDGDLGNVAHGRDSIRRFLDSFKGYKVILQNSITDSISLIKDSAFQKGVYQQITITPQNDTLHLKGEFKVNWVWLSKDGWRIKRIETKPL